jgi:pimeloyl-ACP methyl ester carboxylesterase
MKRLKRFAKWVTGIALVLGVIYMVGPEPPTPKLDGNLPIVPQSLAVLETEINRSEASVVNLKPDNQARIIWADSTRKQKTPLSFLYLHGFGASQAEGAPVHVNLARRYGANLYLARLQDQGVGGDSVFYHLTPENYLASAKKALAVAQTMGTKVVLISTSAGAGLSLYLASQHPEIQALVLYSPAIRLYDDKSTLINGPWGKQIMKQLIGSEYLDFPRKNQLEEQYWSNHYRIEGLITLQSFMEEALNQDTFAKVKCPVYMAYYYKNEEEQDKVVSVAKMLEMFDQLGTPADQKRKEAFPKTGHHVIASYIRSGDWKGVQAGTVRFLEDVVQLQPIDSETKIVSLEK